MARGGQDRGWVEVGKGVENGDICNSVNSKYKEKKFKCISPMPRNAGPYRNTLTKYLQGYKNGELGYFFPTPTSLQDMY